MTLYGQTLAQMLSDAEKAIDGGLSVQDFENSFEKTLDFIINNKEH